jgi:PleD family two-component response regulator
MTTADMRRDGAPGLEERRGRPRILIVDDQPINIQVMHALLAAEYDVCMALGGMAALELCAVSRPDLILLDVAMPDIDGFALCRQLKADSTTCDIPVMFVTSHLDREQEARGFAEGGVDFITKPFHAMVVLARVRTQILLKAQADKLRALTLPDNLTAVSGSGRVEGQDENAPIA